MGGASAGLAFSPRPPTVVLMAGLQGSGKTTAAAKLARFLKKENGSSVALAACDVYRPAAVEQLVTMGGQRRRRRLRARHRPRARSRSLAGRSTRRRWTARTC